MCVFGTPSDCYQNETSIKQWRRIYIQSCLDLYFCSPAHKHKVSSFRGKTIWTSRKRMLLTTQNCVTCECDDEKIVFQCESRIVFRMHHWIQLGHFFVFFIRFSGKRSSLILLVDVVDVIFISLRLLIDFPVPDKLVAGDARDFNSISKTFCFWRERKKICWIAMFCEILQNSNRFDVGTVPFASW